MAPRTRKDDKDDTAEVTTPGVDAKGDGEEKAPARQVRRDANGDGKDDGTPYLNVSTSVIRYDKAGHTVAPGEWTPGVHLDVVGRAARQAGHLLPPSKVD